MAEELSNLDPMAGLSKPWQKFFAKFDEIKDIKISSWKEVHLLAYICAKFEEKFKRKFIVTIKGAPSKSPDIYIVKRIIAMLGTTNMQTAKAYVDWVFDNKIGKQPFRKIGFFLTQGFGNEFVEFRNKAKNNWDRSTAVPEVYKTIAKELGLTINTYGDLAFIQMAVERNKQTDNPHYVLLGNLELIGLDLDRLKVLK